ncbi:hypothetical protein C8R48DRAFT_600910, partial [Suillus tomentosus]
SISTVYHLQTDRQIERIIQEVEQAISKDFAISYYTSNLSITEFTHNHQKYDTRNTSPFSLMMGYELHEIFHVPTSLDIFAVEERLGNLRRLEKKR